MAALLRDDSTLLRFPRNAPAREAAALLLK